MDTEPKTTFNSVWDAIEATQEQAESMKIQSQLMIRIEQLAATNEELEAKLAQQDDLVQAAVAEERERWENMSMMDFANQMTTRSIAAIREGGE